MLADLNWIYVGRLVRSQTVLCCTYGNGLVVRNKYIAFELTLIFFLILLNATK